MTFKALVAQAGGPATAVADDDAEAATDEDVAALDGAGGELDDEDDVQPAASAAPASAATSRPAPASGTAAFTRPADGFLLGERSTLRNTFCLPPPRRPVRLLDSMTTGRPDRWAPRPWREGSTMNRAQATWPVRLKSQRVRPNATDLVRALPLWDVVLFNAASTAPVGAALAVTLFYIGSSFSRANIIAAILAALALCLLMWVAFALLGAAMPKVGGDYVFNGRILHPALGLAGNVAAFIAAWMAAGFWAVEGARAGAGPVLTIIGTVTGNPSWVAWGARVSTDGWVFGIAAGILVILTVLSLLGTKTVVRIMSIMYLVSLVGVLISIIVMAFVSRAGFIAHLNAFSAPYTHQANTYQATIASASKAGLALKAASTMLPSSTSSSGCGWAPAACTLSRWDPPRSGGSSRTGSR